MPEILYAIVAISFLVLGLRLFVKIREIASWNDEDAERGSSAASVPSDLRDLKIEEPDSDFTTHDESEDKPAHP